MLKQTMSQNHSIGLKVATPSRNHRAAVTPSTVSSPSNVFGGNMTRWPIPVPDIPAQEESISFIIGYKDKAYDDWANEVTTTFPTPTPSQHIRSSDDYIVSKKNKYDPSPDQSHPTKQVGDDDVTSLEEMSDVIDVGLNFEDDMSSAILLPTPIAPNGKRCVIDNAISLSSTKTIWNPNDSVLEALFQQLFRTPKKPKPVPDEGVGQSLSINSVPSSPTAVPMISSTSSFNLQEIVLRANRNILRERKGSSSAARSALGRSKPQTPNLDNVHGITWTRQDDMNHPEKWLERYNELVAYKKEYGDCLVPYNWSQNRPLSQWVKRQRYQRKLSDEGRHTTLTEDRMKLLTDIGFVWRSHCATWDERFQELVNYKIEHGHCNVPTRYAVNRPLSVWVRGQRRHFKLLLRPQKKDELASNLLAMERLSKLRAIGFDFHPRRRPQSFKSPIPSKSCCLWPC